MAFSLSFFEVSAQLIPVLFLALVVEERLQPVEEETPGERVTRSWLIALLVMGEVIALAVVAGGLAPSKGAGSLVAGAMLMAGFLLVLPVLSRELTEGRSPWERLGHGFAGLLVIGTVLIALLVIQLR